MHHDLAGRDALDVHPGILTRRPVGAMPKKSPLCVPVRVHRPCDLVPVHQYVVDDDLDLGEPGVDSACPNFEALHADRLRGSALVHRGGRDKFVEDLPRKAVRSGGRVPTPMSS